jgi:signal transduction histidine kinase
MRGARLPLLLLGASILALAAEWSGYDWSAVGDWLPDLTAGSALIVCGLAGWTVRPQSRSGALMTVAGVAWFLPNLATTGVAALDWPLSHLLYAHRGVLVALVLTFPLGRMRGRLDAVVVVVACGLALVAPLWQNPVAAIAFSLVLVAIATRWYLVSIGRDRRLRQAAWWATAALAAIFAGAALAHLVTTPADNASTLRAYQLSLAVLAAVLLTALIHAPWESRRIGDLVVELREKSSTARDRLAHALGDPTLQVGYWSVPHQAYVDAQGGTLDLAVPARGRAATRVDRDGEPLAVLVHDRAVLDDRGLFEAVAAASTLAAANMRLQAEVREQVAELESSRRRLLDAADQERRRLEQRLRSGAERRLAALHPVLEDAAAMSIDGRDAATLVERAEDQLERTLAELRRLALGLHPRVLASDGLAEAIRGLASESPVAVELSLPAQRVPKDVESALYFLCAEALANSAKYANATRISVQLSLDDEGVVAEIADDGVGGADPARGTGLSGLADRIETLNGRLRVASPPGIGTLIRAEIPFREC